MKTLGELKLEHKAHHKLFSEAITREEKIARLKDMIETSKEMSKTCGHKLQPGMRCKKCGCIDENN